MRNQFLRSLHVDRREKAFIINDLAPLLDQICQDWRRVECRGTIGIPDLLLIRNNVPLLLEVKVQPEPGKRISNLKGSQVNLLNATPKHSWLLIGFEGKEYCMVFRGSEVRYGMKSVGGEIVGLSAMPLGIALTPPTY